MTKKRPTNHYIDNKEFLQELKDFKEKKLRFQKEGKPEPRIPEFLGKKFWLIATKLAESRSFRNYTYKEDMISDAIENILTYYHNFDTEKYDNPLAYFTQIVYFAFCRRIAREHKQAYMKYKIAADFVHLSMDEISSQPEIYSNILEYIEEYERKEKIKDEKSLAKSSKKKKDNLENLIEEI